MALSQSVLSGLMKANIEAIPGITVSGSAELQSFTDAIAKAVVDHIKSAAVVIPTALTWPGGLSPAPVVGTGTVT